MDKAPPVDAGEIGEQITLKSIPWFIVSLLGCAMFVFSFSTLGYPKLLTDWMRSALGFTVSLGVLYSVWGTSRIVAINSREIRVKYLFGIAGTHTCEMHELVRVSDAYSGKLPRLLLKFANGRTVALYEFQSGYGLASAFLRRRYSRLWYPSST